MIKRQLLATVSCLALTGVASAADIPARMPVKAPPPAVVTQIWAGPYIGVNGGAAWHRVSIDSIFAGVTLPFDSIKTRATGATFGGQVGYNWQSQNLVFGLEADMNWVHADASRQSIAFGGVGRTLTYNTELNWLATVRARGGVAFGPSLLFLTGGLAIGGVDNAMIVPPPNTCIGNCVVRNRETQIGWTAGGGFERFIAPRVTAKAEVLYVDLGRETVVSGVYTSRFKSTAVVGRLGLNLKW